MALFDVRYQRKSEIEKYKDSAHIPTHTVTIEATSPSEALDKINLTRGRRALSAVPHNLPVYPETIFGEQYMLPPDVELVGEASPIDDYEVHEQIADEPSAPATLESSTATMESYTASVEYSTATPTPFIVGESELPEPVPEPLPPPPPPSQPTVRQKAPGWSYILDLVILGATSGIAYWLLDKFIDNEPLDIVIAVAIGCLVAFWVCPWLAKRTVEVSISLYDKTK